MAFVGDFLLPLLHIGDLTHHGFIPRPSESHHLFGAGFLVIGAMMSVESLAGGVWYRSRFRTLLFPALLIFLGWGMLAVTFIEPNARLIHVTMGLPLIAAGWAEARYRLGLMQRRYADALIVPGLVLAAIDTAGFHLDGSTGTTIAHGGLAVLALTIAALRLYQSGAPASTFRGVLIALAVAAIGVDLWIDSLFQT